MPASAVPKFGCSAAVDEWIKFGNQNPRRSEATACLVQRNDLSDEYGRIMATEITLEKCNVRLSQNEFKEMDKEMSAEDIQSALKLYGRKEDFVRITEGGDSETDLCLRSSTCGDMRRPSATSSYLCVHRTCGELDLRPATVRLHAVNTVRLPVGYPSATFTPILLFYQIIHSFWIPKLTQVHVHVSTSAYMRLRRSMCVYVGVVEHQNGPKCIMKLAEVKLGEGWERSECAGTRRDETHRETNCAGAGDDIFAEGQGRKARAARGRKGGVICGEERREAREGRKGRGGGRGEARTVRRGGARRKNEREAMGMSARRGEVACRTQLRRMAGEDRGCGNSSQRKVRVSESAARAAPLSQIAMHARWEGRVERRRRCREYATIGMGGASTGRGEDGERGPSGTPGSGLARHEVERIQEQGAEGRSLGRVRGARARGEEREREGAWEALGEGHEEEEGGGQTVRAEGGRVRAWLGREEHEEADRLRSENVSWWNGGRDIGGCGTGAGQRGGEGWEDSSNMTTTGGRDEDEY
ncbi:hypothetical protein C8R44DRAFT_741090 [Mycena epipterygia]|nr:hypothetical protein C8R44DRAFT_741090 [Mycena epipterygia]